MSKNSIYPVKADIDRHFHVNKASYKAMYESSINDPDAFWSEQGKRIDWIKPYTIVKNTSFSPDDVSIKWYEDGTLNASVNCIDRHLPGKADKAAILWEGDIPGNSERITYADLYTRVCKLSNALRQQGIRKGDTVTIYMPMIPEAAVAMLACARIGAPHSVVFAGFSPEAIAGRIHACDSKAVITTDESRRGGRVFPLKANIDEALEKPGVDSVETVIVVKSTGGKIEWHDGRDFWYDELVEDQPVDCVPEEMEAEDPLFILYTSGSTGAPKGIVHTTGGYMVYASLTHEVVFDYKDGDIFWAAADIGWITGHTYMVYGPLANGATNLMFEGVPNYPNASRLGQIIDKYGVNILYTAPTVVRALMAENNQAIEGSSRFSLKLLGSVGEPINPAAWEWYYEEFGNQECPIVDTWWQTETGGVLIAPLPGATDLKPGSATKPFFGVQPALMDADAKQQKGEATGSLVILDSWPGQARTIYKDHKRFIETYFSTFPGFYFTGDGAERDADGDFWITGRMDDVLNVSGHRLGTAEIESALVLHVNIAEAAVVGYPHNIKGQGIYAYVTLKHGVEPTEKLQKKLLQLVRREIGAIASPDYIQWAPGMPKTRSGKIMRRILRKIASDESEHLGDISTLADPSVVQELIEGRNNTMKPAA